MMEAIVLLVAIVGTYLVVYDTKGEGGGKE